MPDPVEDLRFRHDDARVRHEEREQRELGGRELDRLAGPPHLVCALVELEVSEAEASVAGGIIAVRPAQDGAYAGDQLS